MVLTFVHIYGIMYMKEGDVMSTIGKRILQRRIELNMSQEELALKIGYKDRSSIAKIESGERDIRQRKVIDLANALDTTPQWLMGYEENATSSIDAKDRIDRIIENRDLLQISELEKIAHQLPEKDVEELVRHAELLLLRKKVQNQSESK